MSSWRRSACYPQSTFYPLSDGPSIRYRRITLSNFRPCSTCLSRSQARFCQYTLCTVADRAERTFESLRYAFGGDHPSQTTRQALSPNPWDLLQPQDVTSRHRGAKPLRRYELLGGISLLSPEYLLSFERRPFHAVPPDHYALVSNLFGLSASQSSPLMPLHSADGYQSS